MATIYEVSALAGVSLSSVSRVLNDHEHVSEKTKTKVKAAMEQLGYRPNAVARSLASSRSDCIGILVSELHGPFYGDILTGIEAELSAAGKHAIIAAGHSNEHNEKEGIEFLIARNCDAIILHVEAVSDEYLVKLSQGSTPIVVLNRYIEGMKDNCFYLDNVLGGYIGTKHLLELGHTELAYISGPMNKQDALDRLTGHKKALAEYKLKFNEALFYEGDFLTTSGHQGMKDIITRNIPFTGVVCANDEMASGAIKGVRDNNLAIPEDCSIIGFDNVFFTEYLYPQLSTVDYPFKEMAEMSARWILKNVYQQKQLKVTNLFDPKLIERESIQALSN